MRASLVVAITIAIVLALSDLASAASVHWKRAGGGFDLNLDPSHQPEHFYEGRAASSSGGHQQAVATDAHDAGHSHRRPADAAPGQPPAKDPASAGPTGRDPPGPGTSSGSPSTAPARVIDKDVERQKVRDKLAANPHWKPRVRAGVIRGANVRINAGGYAFPEDEPEFKHRKAAYDAMPDTLSKKSKAQIYRNAQDRERHQTAGSSAASSSAGTRAPVRPSARFHAAQKRAKALNALKSPSSSQPGAGDQRRR